VRFGILGPTKLRHEDRSFSLGAAKQRGLLALLLLHAGRPVRVDTLIEHLWSQETVGDRRKIIYSMVSRLRAALARAGVRQALTLTDRGYRLDVNPLTVDFHQFRALVERSRAAMAADRPAAAVEDLQQAIDLWRGEPLADLRSSAAEHLRRQLTETLLDAHKLLAEGRLRLGAHDAVLLQLEDLVREYEVDESLARLWVGALCAAGRDDDARRYLAAFRKRYRRELRADPRIDLDSIRDRRPRPAGARPRQLPQAVPGFVGRAEALAELDRFAEPQVGGPNVIVITGMPGLGKTALAVHWSRSRLDRFPDGQLYLDAGAFGPGLPVDPKEALARFLHALGVPADRIPEDAEERRHRFNEMLDGRRLLVVLDNVAESAQARLLIPSAATCRTIVTSRQRLPSLTIQDGVHNLAGTPLSEAEATELLTRIVGEPRAASEQDAMRQLVAIAGGLPLALRVVGEHIAVRPRARLADLVDELREELLWADSEDGDLNTVFGWSYRSLMPGDAALFRRLALHPGLRISLDAAATMAGGDRRETERGLNRLARASLIDHDTARHYRLHDLLRQFAGTRGMAEDPAAETAAVRVTITTWFLRSAANAAALLAPQLSPVPDLAAAPPYVMEFAGESAALEWCQEERENLGAAARYAAQHGLHRLAWQIPAAIHDIFTRTGRYDDLIRLNEIAVESARIDGHIYGEVANLSNLGYALCATHQYSRAIAPLTEAYARAPETADPMTRPVCAHNLGTAYLSIGDTRRAIELFDESRAGSQRLGNDYGESATLHRLGDAYRREGRPELALAAYQEALVIREKIGSVRGQGLTHHQLGALHLAAGRLTLAAEHCAAALAMHDLMHEEAGRCDALITMADIERAMGVEDAVRRARAAVAASVELGDSYRRLHALAVLADALAETDRLHDSARTCSEALEIASELSGPDAEPLLRRVFTTTATISTRKIA
jgi:DNA-binding SARP family transcriptional activator/tetratricopeptide (TPR) repeat protein